MDFTDNENNNKEVMAIFQAESEEILERIFNNLFSLEDALKFAEKLDLDFIEENLSPGGCADLLAVTWFMVHIQINMYEKGVGLEIFHF